MNLDAAQLRHWIEMLGFWGGHLAIWAIVFAESGLLIGFFLPGDSLLFTAGFLASQNILSIQLLLLGAFICAVVGDNVGYATGHSIKSTWFLLRSFMRNMERKPLSLPALCP
jgi:membrane-associated protein